MCNRVSFQSPSSFFDRLCLFNRILLRKIVWVSSLNKLFVHLPLVSSHDSLYTYTLPRPRELSKLISAGHFAFKKPLTPSPHPSDISQRFAVWSRKGLHKILSNQSKSGGRKTWAPKNWNMLFHVLACPHFHVFFLTCANSTSFLDSRGHEPIAQGLFILLRDWRAIVNRWQCVHNTKASLSRGSTFEGAYATQSFRAKKEWTLFQRIFYPKSPPTPASWTFYLFWRRFETQLMPTKFFYLKTPPLYFNY